MVINSTTPNGKIYPGIIVDIPGGVFEMGSPCDDEVHDHDEHTKEGKTARVEISSFRLGKTEVTIGQYIDYLMESLGVDRDTARGMLPIDRYNNNKSPDDFPIVALSDEEKRRYARYYGGRLFTAAEYEYASKGPSHTDLYGTPIDKANIDKKGGKATARVCGKYDEKTGRHERENGFGICDLAGNAMETTSDKYKSDFYDEMSRKDPANPFIRGFLSLFYSEIEYRGGAVDTNQREFARASNRWGRFTGILHTDGFRVAWPSKT